MNIYTSEKEMLKAQCSDVVSNGGLDPRDKFVKREWVGLSTTEEELCISQSPSALEAVRNACDRLMEKNA